MQLLCISSRIAIMQLSDGLLSNFQATNFDNSSHSNKSPPWLELYQAPQTKLFNCLYFSPYGLSQATNTDQVQVVLELVCRYRLRQHISCILWSVNLLKNNFSCNSQLPYLMESNINMLCPSMINLMLCQVNGTLTVTMQLNSSLVQTKLFD